MRLFDSHTHLQDTRVWNNLDVLIERASEAGVSALVCCGSCEDDWGRVLEISQKYPQVIPAFGIHPWYISERSNQWHEKLEKILIEVPHAAVGEIGLDHTIENRNDEEQKSVFTNQLQIAIRLKRPVSIHCRKAWQDLLSSLKKVNGLSDGGAVHSYSGSPDIIPELVKYGLSVSFSGSLTYENNRKARRSVIKVPLQKLLIETDTPDISPQSRPDINEPSFLADTVAVLSEIMHMSKETVAEKTFENGMRLFNLKPQ